MDESSLPFLREVILFLALTGILIPLLQRFRLSQVLGFLVTGAVFGPFGLGLFVDTSPWLRHVTFPRLEGARGLADFGVVFLLFLVGLELSAERLWAMRRWVFGAGSAQVLVSALCIGLLAFGFGNTWQSAVVLGLVLSLSSTAIVVQLLTERRELASGVGRASFSVLLLQDLAVVPLLVLIGILGQAQDGNFLWLIVVALLKGAAAIGVIVLLGRGVLRPLFHRVSVTRQPETFMAMTLLSVLGIAALTWLAGLSMALGAFLAGLLLAETEYRHEIQVTIEPFKGLLMGMFFMTVGMGVDVRTLLNDPVWIPLSVLGLFAVKSLVMIPLFRRFGLTWGQAVESGVLLGQGGEFAFIVVGIAVMQQVLPHDTGQFVMLVVGFSMLVTPAAARIGRELGQWVDRNLSPPVVVETPHVPELNGHIVIAGFGRVGQLLGQLLDAQNIPYLALEHDAKTANEAYRRGLPVFSGDASRPDLLRQVRVDQARAVVITMDHYSAALNAVGSIRRDYPEVRIFARARDEKHAQLLIRAGANEVIPETLESSLQLAAFVLDEIGMPEEASAELIQREREKRIVSFREE
ncbi:MAG: cation:proton antiporter [Gammaproteobacteria bacterium]|nr:cation:proton antiporter [Gammaproteobacteria bacterium]